MLYNIYVIKDAKSSFMVPTFDKSDATAKRNFQFACRNKDSLLNSNPNDFALFCVGCFDDETGVVTPFTPTQICDAAQCLQEV